MNVMDSISTVDARAVIARRAVEAPARVCVDLLCVQLACAVRAAVDMTGVCVELCHNAGAGRGCSKRRRHRSVNGAFSTPRRAREALKSDNNHLLSIICLRDDYYTKNE